VYYVYIFLYGFKFYFIFTERIKCGSQKNSLRWLYNAQIIIIYWFYIFFPFSVHTLKTFFSRIDIIISWTRYRKKKKSKIFSSDRLDVFKFQIEFLGRYNIYNTLISHRPAKLYTRIYVPQNTMRNFETDINDISTEIWTKYNTMETIRRDRHCVYLHACVHDMLIYEKAFLLLEFSCFSLFFTYRDNKATWTL
jgi:hypothetical protein